MFLIELGANSTIISMNNLTPIIIAFQYGDKELLDFISTLPSFFKIFYDSKILFFLVQNREFASNLELFLRTCPSDDVSIVDRYENSLLMLAAKKIISLQYNH